MHSEELTKHQRSDRLGMRWSSLVARMGKRRGTYGLVVEKSEENRPRGTSRRR